MEEKNDGNEAVDSDEPDRLDVEVALLAALTARDVGDADATEDVDLSTLTEAEKQTLLALMKQRLEMAKEPVSVGTPQMGEERL